MGASGVLNTDQPHHGWSSLVLFLLHHLSTTTLALALALDDSNATGKLVDEPLPSVEGCELDYQRHCSLTSEDAAAPAPPLSKGMWAVQSRSTKDLEREDHEGGTQEVGGPYGASRKRATTFVVARFLPSLPPRLTLTTINPTDISTVTWPQHVDDPKDSGDVDANHTNTNDSNHDYANAHLCTRLRVLTRGRRLDHPNTT
jgi:hypothetical protein